jgi:hypothetical protein
MKKKKRKDLKENVLSDTEDEFDATSYCFKNKSYKKLLKISFQLHS